MLLGFWFVDLFGEHLHSLRTTNWFAYDMDGSGHLHGFPDTPFSKVNNKFFYEVWVCRNGKKYMISKSNHFDRFIELKFGVRKAINLPLGNEGNKKVESLGYILKVEKIDTGEVLERHFIK